ASPLEVDHLTLGSKYEFRLVTVPLRTLDDAGLTKVSRAGQLSLSLDEMWAIQTHFRGLGRDPTDVELETLAQTWSEHCSHKTLKGLIDFNGRRINNLLKETIFGATQEIRRRLGKDDWCVSVFEDNAGVVKFNDRYHVCFKVETHNHPSAIEPYGGANPVNGAVCFDPRYLANPLVYCGTVGLIPVDRAGKAAQPGDLIVAVGGRIGRDGIHGATFSSLELSAESEKVSGGAVQIGNAITEKKMIDALLEARDRGLYHAITDCG